MKHLLWTKNKAKQSSTDIGSTTEHYAAQYLLSQGLQEFTRNFRNRQGEIDLIMKDGATWVFVEVKYRKNDSFGGPLAAISYNKQQKIKHCAEFFLQQNNLNEYNTQCRFDVVGLLGDLHQPKITWLKNAF